MNTLIFSLDAYFLGLTKNVTRSVYLWFGLTNFQLARFCFYIMMSLCVVDLYFSQLQKIDAFSYALKNILTLILVPVVWSASVMSEHTTKDSWFANPCRKGLWVYWRLIIIFLALLNGGTFLWVYFDHNELLYWKPTICSYALFNLFLALAFCFTSVEPEPPSQSKLRKGLNMMKSLFSSNALPQPA